MMARKRDRKRPLGAAVLTAAAMAVVAGDATAGGFAIREQSAYGQGSSFAGAATCGESIQGSFWNPAAVTCNRGLLTAEGSLSLIVPKSDITTLPGSTFAIFGDPGDVGRDGVVPSSAVSYNFNDTLFFGLTVNAPFGLTTKTNYNHAGQIHARTSEVFSLNAQPIIGYRVNDVLAVAVGAQIQYFDVRLTQALGVAPGAPSAILEGDDVGFGFTAGVMITPTPWTEIGIGFRSAIEHELEGDLNIAGPIRTELTLPEVVSVGLRQRITDRFSLLGTVEWSNWSRFGTFPVTTPGGAVLLDLPFEWEDSWFFSVGGEYDWSDRWTFRGGVGWEMSPISDEVRGIRLPDDDRLWLSAGLSYDVSDRLKLNAGYSFLTTFDTEIDIEPGNPLFDPAAPLLFYGEVDANVHIFSAGLKYTFGGAPAYMEPVIAKN